MRILFDHQIFINQKVGGISRYVTDLNKGLNNIQDTDSTIIAYLSGNRYLEKGKGIVGVPFGKRMTRTLNQLMIRHRMIRDADLIHPTYYNIKYLRSCKKPVIITVHDLIYFKYQQYFPDFERIQAMISYAVNNCDGIICISANTKEELDRYCEIKNKTIAVIHHGLNIAEHLSPNRSNKGKENYFLYVGSRRLYKNFGLLLQSFIRFLNQYRHFKLIIVGGEPLSSEEQTIIGSYPDNFIHAPFVNDKELYRLYSESKALVITSLEEGFCYPAIEALLSGTELICSDIPVLREVIGESASYFNPYDSDSLLACMIKCAEESCDEKKAVDEAFRNYYSLERMCNDTRRFYSAFS